MFQEIIVLTVAYVVLIGYFYAPQCHQTDGAVQYFPEIDDQPVTPSPAPDISVVENLPVEPIAIATVTTFPLPTDLKTLTAKKLKAIARTQKIPRYGSLTKKQLLIALA
jgi:hypothetical protein